MAPTECITPLMPQQLPLLLHHIAHFADAQHQRLISIEKGGVCCLPTRDELMSNISIASIIFTSIRFSACDRTLSGSIGQLN